MTEKTDNEPWWKPDIFDYLSYREFMKDFYTKAKEHTRGMSFRKLSKQSGFSSPNFYKLVMENQRNLSVEAAERVATALKLKPDEASFFMALVDFDQAENRTKKMSHSSGSVRRGISERLGGLSPIFSSTSPLVLSHNQRNDGTG